MKHRQAAATPEAYRLEQVLGQVERLLGLRGSYVLKLLTWRAVLSRRSWEDMRLWLTWIRKQAQPTQESRPQLEARDLAKALADFLDPDTPGGIFAQVQKHWATHQSCPDQYSQYFSRLGRELRIWLQESDTLPEDSKPRSLHVVCPINQPWVPGRWQKALTGYRGSLNQIHSRLVEWSRDRSHGVALAGLIGAAIKAPPAVHRDLFDELTLLHDWQFRTVERVVRILGVAGAALTADRKAVVPKYLVEICQAKAELDLPPFLETCRETEGPGVVTVFVPRELIPRHESGLLVPGFRGHLSRTYVADYQSKHLRALAIRSPDQNCGEESRYEYKLACELVKLLDCLDREPAEDFHESVLFLIEWLLGVEEASNLRKWADRICELLGRKSGDDGWCARTVPKNRISTHTHQDALYEVRVGLQDCLRLMFGGGSGEEVAFQFSDAQAGGEIGVEGLYLQGENGQEVLVKPETGISAGLRPDRLLEHMKTLGEPRKLFQSLEAELKKPEIWAHLRAEYDSDNLRLRQSQALEDLGDLLRNCVSNMDIAAADRDGWEKWLAEFKRLWNKEVKSRPASLLRVDSQEELEKAGGDRWEWDERPLGALTRRGRQIKLGENVLAQRTGTFRSRGLRAAPELLKQLASEYVDSHEDLRDPDARRGQDVRRRQDVHPGQEVRRELAVRLHRHLAGGGTPAESELLAYCQLIQVELFPEKGVRLDPYGPQDGIAQCEWEFNEAKVGTVIRVKSPAILLSQRRFLTDALGQPLGAKVVLSRGKQPDLLVHLERLEHTIGNPFESASGYAATFCPYQREDQRRDLLILAMKWLNHLHGLQAESQGGDWAGDVVQLAREIADLGGAVIPSPCLTGDYDMAAIDAAVRRASNRLARKDVFREPGEQLPSRHPPGEIARVQSFACIYAGELLAELGDDGRVRWIKSLGPQSPQCELGTECIRAMHAANVYGYLAGDALSRHRELQVQLNNLSVGTFEGQPSACEQSTRLLCELLVDVDRVSDLAEADNVWLALEGVRRRILAFCLNQSNVRLEPGWPEGASEYAPSADDREFEVASEQYGIRYVLSRRIAVAGQWISRDVVVVRGNITVAVEDPEWSLIQELYRRLRETYRGAGLQVFAQFLEQRDRYLKTPNTTILMSIVAAAESLGMLRFSEDDPPGLRRAIQAMEERIAEERGLRRVHFQKGQPLPTDKDYGYATSGITIKGKRAGHVVRILAPAYQDQSGRVHVRGKILITQEG